MKREEVERNSVGESKKENMEKVEKERGKRTKRKVEGAKIRKEGEGKQKGRRQRVHGEQGRIWKENRGEGQQWRGRKGEEKWAKAFLEPKSASCCRRHLSCDTPLASRTERTKPTHYTTKS